jgi:hypothetical protein
MSQDPSNLLTPLEENAERITFSPIELHVFVLLWQGAPRQTIAEAIQRTPRQVSRITKQLTSKLGSFDPRLLRYRLEDELFRRIPTLSDRDLIAALKLYPAPRCVADPDSSRPSSNRDVQSLLREVIPRGDADAAET